MNITFTIVKFDEVFTCRDIANHDSPRVIPLGASNPRSAILESKRVQELTRTRMNHVCTWSECLAVGARHDELPSHALSFRERWGLGRSEYRPRVDRNFLVLGPLESRAADRRF